MVNTYGWRGRPLHSLSPLINRSSLRSLCAVRGPLCWFVLLMREGRKPCMLYRLPGLHTDYIDLSQPAARDRQGAQQGLEAAGAGRRGPRTRGRERGRAGAAQRCTTHLAPLPAPGKLTGIKRWWRGQDSVRPRPRPRTQPQHAVQDYRGHHGRPRHPAAQSG